MHKREHSFQNRFLHPHEKLQRFEDLHYVVIAPVLPSLIRSLILHERYLIPTIQNLLGDLKEFIKDLLSFLDSQQGVLRSAHLVWKASSLHEKPADKTLDKVLGMCLRKSLEITMSIAFLTASRF